MHNIRTCLVTAVLLPVILVAVPVPAGSEGLGGLRLSPSEGVITPAQSTSKQPVAGSGDEELGQAAETKVRAGTGSKFAGGPPKAGAGARKSVDMDIKKRCDEGTLKGEACDCIEGTLEGKACDGYRALLLKKMEEASEPIDAGKMAKDESKHVRDTTQAGLKNAIGNLEEIEAVVDAGMPGALDDRNVTAPDLGDSDSLGSL